MTREPRSSGTARPPGKPAAAAVARLIGRAERHPLGVPFLLDGSLDAVAATFGAHAFTVEAARARLAMPPDSASARPHRGEPAS